MLYHDEDDVPESAAADVPAAVPIHADPEPNEGLHSATHTPLSMNQNASVAKAAAQLAPAMVKSVQATAVTGASGPVLVGKVVSAESSRISAHRQVPHPPQAAPASPDEAPRSPSASSADSGSAASTNGIVGDYDKMELLFDFGRYVGQVDPLTGLRDGEGCLHYKSGNVYTGHWRDGAADGFGEKRYKNGDIYRGNWRDGKRQGRGAYLFVQGHFYDGMYANDEPDGYGIYTTLKGDRYAGNWKTGRKCGKGRETLVNGQVFVGNWRNGKKQGRGKLYLPGAEGYIFGIWNDDKFFRELTENEMGVEGREDIVDEFGLPRDASAPPVTPPWMKPAPLGTAVTDRVLMGVTALEDRMESLGRALERVMSGNYNEDSGAGDDGGSAGGGGRTPGAPSNSRGNASGLRFSGYDRPTTDGVLADGFETYEDDGDQDYEGPLTLGVAPRGPQVDISANVLSTAEGEEAVAEESSADEAAEAAEEVKLTETAVPAQAEE